MCLSTWSYCSSRSGLCGWASAQPSNRYRITVFHDESFGYGLYAARALFGIIWQELAVKDTSKDAAVPAKNLIVRNP